VRSRSVLTAADTRPIAASQVRNASVGTSAGISSDKPRPTEPRYAATYIWSMYALTDISAVAGAVRQGPRTDLQVECVHAHARHPTVSPRPWRFPARTPQTDVAGFKLGT